MKRLLVMSLALFAGGCTLPPGPSIVVTRPLDALSQQRWHAHQASLADIRGFGLEGRVAESGLGRSATLLWRQSPDGAFDVHLSGPLGVGALAIRGDASGVIVRNRDGSQYTPDPQGWMQAHLGWSLPLVHLHAWALGLPADAPIEQLSIGPDGLLQSATQDGWTVRYLEYQTVGTRQLPRRLDLEKSGTRLRLVIDRWNAIDVAGAS